jgi:holo-[acyl-carrier protein] synthase
MSLKVGIDLVAVETVEASIRSHADSYLERIYTPQELLDCRTGDGQADATRLAARFAAKEALLKALRAADESVPWNAIGVVGDAHGAPRLELTGAAAALAQERGIEDLDVSLTHEGPFAAAIVMVRLRD